MRIGISNAPGWIVNTNKTRWEVEEALFQTYKGNARLVLAWLRNDCKAVDSVRKPS